MPGEARFWSKQCDMPPGIAAAVSPGYCVDYDKQYSNGYYVVSGKLTFSHKHLSMEQKTAKCG